MTGDYCVFQFRRRSLYGKILWCASFPNSKLPAFSLIRDFENKTPAETFPKFPSLLRNFSKTLFKPVEFGNETLFLLSTLLFNFTLFSTLVFVTILTEKKNRKGYRKGYTCKKIKDNRTETFPTFTCSIVTAWRLKKPRGYRVSL